MSRLHFLSLALLAEIASVIFACIGVLSLPGTPLPHLRRDGAEIWFTSSAVLLASDRGDYFRRRFSGR